MDFNQRKNIANDMFKVALFIDIILLRNVDGQVYWTAPGHTDNDLSKMFVMKDLHECNKYTAKSIHENNLLVINCFRKRIMHCIKKGKGVNTGAIVSDITRKNIYCENIFFYNKFNHNREKIRFLVVNHYMMHFHMLLFNFEWSRFGCKAHSLAVGNLEPARTNWFCGKRLPWVIITKADEVYLQLILTLRQAYKANIFYSIIKRQWIQLFFKQIHLLVSTSTPLQINNLRVEFSIMESYLFYIRVKPMQYIEVIVRENINHVRVYDGPGFLSHLLSEEENNQCITSSYLGLVHLVLPHHTTAIRLDLSGRDHKGSIPRCFDKTKSTFPIPIYLSGSIKQGTSCFHIFHSEHTALKIRLLSFTFVGANMLDDLDTCYYGGLFIQKVGSDETISFCENVYGHTIYGESPDIKVLIVWYAGYSRGYISGEMLNALCITTHLPWITTSSMDNQVTLKNNEHYCQRVICPSLNKDNASKCVFTIKGFHKSLGPARLHVDLLYSLDKCSDSHTSYQKYNLSVLHFDNWPMGNMIKDTISKQLSHEIVEIKFLHVVNFSLPYFCDTRKRFLQYGVTLVRSTCVKIRNKNIVKARPILNTIVLSSECNNHVILFRGGKMDIVYMVQGTEETGLYMYLDNYQCAYKCNYTLVLTVVDTVNNTFYEYTSYTAYSSLGLYRNHQLFTGYYHKGFKLKIIPPEHPCPIEESRCALTAQFHSRIHRIGISNLTFIDQGSEEWHFHRNR